MNFLHWLDKWCCWSSYSMPKSWEDLDVEDQTVTQPWKNMALGFWTTWIWRFLIFFSQVALIPDRFCVQLESAHNSFWKIRWQLWLWRLLHKSILGTNCTCFWTMGLYYVHSQIVLLSNGLCNMTICCTCDCPWKTFRNFN